jgi:hypothetical protein
VKYIKSKKLKEIFRVNNKDAEQYVKGGDFEFTTEKEFNAQQKEKTLKTMRGSK